MNAYEMTFIVRPDRDEEETRAVVQTVTDRIETAGGEVVATAPWNPPRRRMAYPINEFGDGFYVTTVFRLDGQALRPIENALKLNDNVLRYLVVRASELNVQQVQQRAQQAHAAPQQPVQAVPQPAPSGTPDQTPDSPEEAPTTTAATADASETEVVEQPDPTAVEQASPGETVDAVRPAAAGASAQSEE